MKIQGGCWSDIGCREVNQDAVVYRAAEQNGESFVLAAVCDGIGGMEHGEVASAFLAGQIEMWFKEILAWLDIGRTDPEILFSHLKDGAELWNDGLREIQSRDHLRTGSTMSVLMLIRERYYIVHVGDSRIYRYRSGLAQLTEDASVPRMKNGRVKHYLNNFMGKSDELLFQELQGNVEEGDLFIICSDGFYHQLRADDMIELDERCTDNSEIPSLCSDIIRRMPERGERDNISLAVAKVLKI